MLKHKSKLIMFRLCPLTVVLAAFAVPAWKCYNIDPDKLPLTRRLLGCFLVFAFGGLFLSVLFFFLLFGAILIQVNYTYPPVEISIFGKLCK